MKRIGALLFAVAIGLIWYFFGVFWVILILSILLFLPIVGALFDK